VVQIREDKTPEEASGPDYIAELFHLQTRKAATATKRPTAAPQSTMIEELGRARADESDGVEGEEPDSDQG